MRFVLREYLMSLKEDGELDSFVEELLRSMRLIPMTKIQRGRQFGVDIPAVGTDIDERRKVFLFVIKQGDFSRKNWDINVNDIRPSLGEILDVYIPTRIPKPFNDLDKKIIVCCNGMLDQTVNDNWSGYINKETKPGLEFEFWGIDKLVDLANENQLGAEILTPDLALVFRRALSFIDLPDYNLSHLYRFLHDLLPEKEIKELSKKEVIKKLRLVNLCLGIINSWCKSSNNLKPALIASERIMLNTWGWLLTNDLLENQKNQEEYFKIIITARDLFHHYIIKIKPFLEVQDGLSVRVGDHNEYCILTFEHIGLISLIGIIDLWQSSFLPDDVSKETYVSASVIADCLSSLIENNISSYSPRFDENCIEIVLGMLLLFETGRFKAARGWLTGLINYVLLNHKVADFIPLFTTDLEKINSSSKDQKSSMLFTILAELSLVLKLNDRYNTLRTFLLEQLPELDLQMWFPDKDIDEVLFRVGAFHSGNTMVSISLPENQSLTEMYMKEEQELFKDELKSSIYKYGFSFLAFVAFRHFRTYPFPNIWRGCLSTRHCFVNNAE